MDEVRAGLEECDEGVEGPSLAWCLWARRALGTSRISKSLTPPERMPIGLRTARLIRAGRPTRDRATAEIRATRSPRTPSPLVASSPLVLPGSGPVGPGEGAPAEAPAARREVGLRPAVASARLQLRALTRCAARLRSC